MDIPKWRHYKGSNVGENFFNIKNAIEHSKQRGGSIIICEGPSDVMWLHQNGFKNAGACLNNKITKVQKGILLKNFMSIYLMLDADSGGETGRSAIINEIKGYFNIFDVKIADGKDPDNLNLEELEKAFRDARKI
jgi:DNA primase